MKTIFWTVAIVLGTLVNVALELILGEQSIVVFTLVYLGCLYGTKLLLPRVSRKRSGTLVEPREKDAGQDLPPVVSTLAEGRKPLLLLGISVAAFVVVLLLGLSLRMDVRQADTSDAPGEPSSQSSPAANREGSFLSLGAEQWYQLNENGILQTLELFSWKNGAYQGRVELAYENDRIVSITRLDEDDNQVLFQEFLYEGDRLKAERVNGQEYPMGTGEFVGHLMVDEYLSSMESYYMESGSYALFVCDNKGMNIISLYFDECGVPYGYNVNMENNQFGWYSTDFALQSYTRNVAYNSNFDLYASAEYVFDGGSELKDILIYDDEYNEVNPVSCYQITANDVISAFRLNERMIYIQLPLGRPVMETGIRGAEIQLFAGDGTTCEIALRSEEILSRDGIPELCVFLPGETDMSTEALIGGELTLTLADGSEYVASW